MQIYLISSENTIFVEVPVFEVIRPFIFKKIWKSFAISIGNIQLNIYKIIYQ